MRTLEGVRRWIVRVETVFIRGAHTNPVLPKQQSRNEHRAAQLEEETGRLLLWDAMIAALRKEGPAAAVEAALEGQQGATTHGVRDAFKNTASGEWAAARQGDRCC